jgi:hypothetical protein
MENPKKERRNTMTLAYQFLIYPSVQPGGNASFTRHRFLFRAIIAVLVSVLIAAGALAVERRVEPMAGGRADADGKTLWFDAREIGLEGQGWQEKEQSTDYGRLPAKAQGKVSDAVWKLSKQSAGLCVRFRTDATAILVRWELSSRAFSK